MIQYHHDQMTQMNEKLADVAVSEEIKKQKAESERLRFEERFKSSDKEKNRLNFKLKAWHKKPP